MGDKGDKGDMGESKKKAGYEYLLAYKITMPIYDYTVEFCTRCSPYHPNHPNRPNRPNFPPLSSARTHDQMVQAARSGMQNISEGNKQQGLKGYIKLSGIARGSLEELLKDYTAYARQYSIPIWSSDKAKREIREIREIWEILKKIRPFLISLISPISPITRIKL